MAAPARSRVALVVGYNGEGYFGLQWQPGHPSVEAELVAALRGAGCLPPHGDAPAASSQQPASQQQQVLDALSRVSSAHKRRGRRGHSQRQLTPHP
jgi:tRNA U38,U39,U40 pseudouridine synthase TruA